MQAVGEGDCVVAGYPRCGSPVDLCSGVEIGSLRPAITNRLALTVYFAYLKALLFHLELFSKFRMPGTFPG